MSEEVQGQQEQNDGEQGGNEFTPITSQADFDRKISERISRERAKFSDYDDLKAKAEKFDQVEEEAKSELEKAQDRATKAENRANELETAAQIQGWKKQVEGETGVPADALAGSTLDEIQAHAEKIRPLMGAEPSTPRTVVRGEGEPDMPLNGAGIEGALRNALGIH